MKRFGIALSVLLMLVFVSACDVNDMIDSPDSGTIVDTPTVVVTGHLSWAAKEGGTMVVNGVTATFTEPRKWQAEIPMTPVGYVTIVRAVYTEPGGRQYMQETALVNGPKIDDGEFSPDGVGMRFTNTGLANLGPIINRLATGSFDISALILAQDPLIPPTDAGSGVTISGKAYEAGAEAANLSTTATDGGLVTPITITNLFLGLDLNLSGFVSGPCKLEIEVPTANIDTTFDFSPDAAEPDKVDVNLVGSPSVSLEDVSYEFISGVCDPSTPIVGSIINSSADGAIQDSIRNGFQSQLGDPDGSGPADSPIAEAIETALASISIAGPVGEAVTAHLDAPFTEITESSTGLEFRADADFNTSFGTGPEQCVQPPHAPDFTSSFDVPGAFPTLGGTTPSGDPYGLGLVISASAFNQLLSSMTECGLLNQELEQITLNGSTYDITPGILSLLVPQFATLPADADLFIRVDPQAAPFITPSPGPNGAMAEMQLADLRIDFIQRVTVPGESTPRDHRLLSLAVEAPLGLDMGFDDVNDLLAPTISAPAPADVSTRVTFNGIDADEAATATVFSSLFPNFVDSLSASFAAFPLPSFLGLDLSVSEITRQGNSFVLYSNLVETPTTRLANVTVTDLSTADFNHDDLTFDSWEWRHKVRKKIGSNRVDVNLDGMVGADACCTVDDELTQAHAGYRVAFDVESAPGESWRVDLSHLMRGAHTAKSEGVGGGFGAQSNISTVSGRYRVDGGSWVNFNFDVGCVTGFPCDSPWQGGWSGASFHEPFQGTNGASFTGSTSKSVEVEFGFDVQAWSDSNVAFPAESGNESAIRFGANDSLTNNFTAGDYPGQGSRDIAQDGHFGTITLTTL